MIKDAGREWNVPCETLVTIPRTPALERKGAKSMWVTFTVRLELEGEVRV
jgi:hypothetical protein